MSDNLPEKLDRLAAMSTSESYCFLLRSAAARIRELEAERDDMKRAWLGAVEADNKRNGALLKLYREALSDD